MQSFFSPKSDHDMLQSMRRDRRRGQNTPVVSENSGKEELPKRAEGEQFRELTATVNIATSDMNSTYSAKLATTEELAKLINNLFKPVFPQWYGCRVFVDNGRVRIQLYFADNVGAQYPEGTIKVLEPIQANNRNIDRTGIGLVQAMNSRGQYATVYKLTQEGKDALGEFVYENSANGKSNYIGDYRDRNYNWNNKQICCETIDRDIANRTTICVMIEIDPLRLCKKLYGAEKEPGINWVYDVHPIRPIPGSEVFSGNMAIGSSKWLLDIKQIDPQDISDAMANVTGYLAVGSLGIYRN